MSPSVAPSRRPPAEQWLRDHGDAMFAFARLRLGDADAARDAVQDALLAAWRARDSFKGQSTVRTWLLGILRHKVLDALRERARDAAMRKELNEHGRPTQFCPRGTWLVRPRAIPDPPPSEREEFRKAVQAAISALPDGMRQAIVLREIDGLGTDAICEVLGITPTNLWTLIHRAKLRLRETLGGWTSGARGDDR